MESEDTAADESVVLAPEPLCRHSSLGLISAPGSWLISRRSDDFVDPSIRIAQDYEVQSEHGTDESAPRPVSTY